MDRSGLLTAVDGNGPTRGRLTAYIEQRRLVWELAMAAISIAYLALSIASEDQVGTVPGAVIVGLGTLLFAEFAARCWDAPSRLDYARHHWLDVVACLPFTGGLRVLRLIRLVRLIRSGSGLRLVVETNRAAHSEVGPLWFLIPSIVLLWIGSATAFWMLEHGRNAQLHTFADALYWSFLSATTAGREGIAATTMAGKVLTGFVAFIAIGLFGVTSARLTALWLHERDQGHEPVISEIRALRREVAELRALLQEDEESD
jgi:voltage-gated potassium channel